MIKKLGLLTGKIECNEFSATKKNRDRFHTLKIIKKKLFRKTVRIFFGFQPAQLVQENGKNLNMN